MRAYMWMLLALSVGVLVEAAPDEGPQSSPTPSDDVESDISSDNPRDQPCDILDKLDEPSLQKNNIDPSAESSLQQQLDDCVSDTYQRLSELPDSERSEINKRFVSQDFDNLEESNPGLAARLRKMWRFEIIRRNSPDVEDDNTKVAEIPDGERSEVNIRWTSQDLNYLEYHYPDLVARLRQLLKFGIIKRNSPDREENNTNVDKRFYTIFKSIKSKFGKRNDASKINNSGDLNKREPYKDDSTKVDKRFYTVFRDIKKLF